MDDDNTDLSTMDRGDKIETPAPAAPAAPDAQTEAEKEAQALIDKAAEKDKPAPDADEKPAPDADEKPRDQQGRFAKKDDGQFVPKNRFDEAVNKERAARIAAEERANRLEADIAKASHGVDVEKLEGEISALEKDYTTLMMKGEAEKAAEVLSQIRHKEREIRATQDKQAEFERDEARRKQDAVNEEASRVQAVITDLETNYPEFNENSEQFEPRLVNFLIAEQARLIKEAGMSPSEALRKAADDMIELRGSSTKLTDASTSTSSGKTGERKADAVKRNVDAASKQPGSMKEVGVDSDKAGTNKPQNEDASLMTFEEFSALPEETRKRMRGDTI